MTTAEIKKTFSCTANIMRYGFKSIYKYGVDKIDEPTIAWLVSRANDVRIEKSESGTEELIVDGRTIAYREV